MPVLQWGMLVRRLEGEPTYGDTQGGTTQLAGNHTPAPYLNPTEPHNLALGVLPLKGWFTNAECRQGRADTGRKEKGWSISNILCGKKMPISLKHSLQWPVS